MTFAHLSSGDSVEEMVYSLVASATLLSCGQLALEDTPVQELNHGFSSPPYSRI